MKKATLIIGIIILSCTAAISQNYQTAVGYRGSLSQQGISLKYFATKYNAVELMVSNRWQGIETSVLFEYHMSAFDVRQLNWCMGVGAHLGLVQGINVPQLPEDKQYNLIGIDGFLGLEYTFEDIPINIGFNWKPSYTFIGHSSFWGDDGGFTLRFVF